MKKKTICVDFDGTVVSWDFPKIGQDIGAVPVLKRLVDNGHKIILLTMRSGETLQDAVEWFKSNDIPLYDVNNNKSQWRWSASRKTHGDLFIEDQALNAPLKYDLSISPRPFYDWKLAEELLEKEGYFE